MEQPDQDRVRAALRIRREGISGYPGTGMQHARFLKAENIGGRRQYGPEERLPLPGVTVESFPEHVRMAGAEKF